MWAFKKHLFLLFCTKSSHIHMKSHLLNHWLFPWHSIFSLICFSSLQALASWLLLPLLLHLTHICRVFSIIIFFQSTHKFSIAFYLFCFLFRHLILHVLWDILSYIFMPSLCFLANYLYLYSTYALHLDVNLFTSSAHMQFLVKSVLSLWASHLNVSIFHPCYLLIYHKLIHLSRFDIHESAILDCLATYWSIVSPDSASLYLLKIYLFVDDFIPVDSQWLESACGPLVRFNIDPASPEAVGACGSLWSLQLTVGLLIFCLPFQSMPFAILCFFFCDFKNLLNIRMC